MSLDVEVIPVGAFQENAYLVVDTDTKHAVLIDPGDEPARLLAAVDAAGAQLDAIWLTHAHVDHVGGIAGIVRERHVPIVRHPAGDPLYHAAVEHGRVFGLRVEAPPPPDRAVAEGDVLRVGTLRFTVLEAPGHAPGHVVFHGHGVAFVGDCLFAGSIGRTDLPMSDAAQLARSLDRIVALGDDTVVYPGHGPATTIGRERVTNPFLNGAVRIVGRS